MDLRTGMAGVITAGGASRRFGSDKARHVLDGATLLERVAWSLGDTSPRWIVASHDRYRVSGWAHLPDTRPGEGPLAGLEAALGATTGWTAYAAVDLPYLVPEFWRRLARAASGGPVICPLDAAGRPQPLAALYHRDLRPTVTALLDTGERSMRSLLEQAGTAFVPWSALEDLGPDLLRNVNRPEDLPPPTGSTC